MTNQCEHGQLARQCLMCEQAAEIVELSRCLSYVRCDVCGALFSEKTGCVLADHVEAYEAIAKSRETG